jgi:glycosyltransferase involved in cell wall biosynthesis
MRVLISAVGKRTEHWEGFFAALAARPDLELAVQVADVTDLTLEWLERLVLRYPGRFSYRLAGHLIGEDRTGHMASVVYAPGAWRDWPAARPDVVHIIGEPSYLSTAQTIAVARRRWPDVPITQYAAQNVVIRFPWPFPWVERWAYRRIDVALPITQAARGVLRHKGYRGAAPIVPLGVDRDRFAPAPGPAPGPFTVGFVGRLEPHKGVTDLLAAAQRARARLLVVGDGAQREDVLAAAAERPGEVELVPWCSHDELPGLLRRMHVLALPSVEVVQRNVLPWIRVPLREQFGRVLVEAMACGVPCVATTVGEMGEVLGDAGVLTPPADVDALTDAFASLRTDPVRRAGLRRAALCRAERFGWDRIAAQVHELWSHAAGGDIQRAVHAALHPERNHPTCPTTST